MAKTKLEKIASIEEEMRQLENQRKQLLQSQKDDERKARNHRLCKRGGLWESLAPGTITLTDEQFRIFLEKTIITEHSRRILDGLTAQNAATATPQGAEAAAQGDTTATAETTETQRGERA